MFTRSWNLAKASWSVITANPELLWLPVLSGLSALVVVAAPSAALGVALVGGLSEDNPIVWVLFALIAYLGAVVGIFFQVATVWAANEHFEGRDPNLRGAVAAAGGHLGHIAGWAVLVTGIRLLIGFLRQRGAGGAIAGGLISALWTFASFLVVPAIVLAGMGPVDALKHSTTALKRTWGENIVGRLGLGALGFLAFLAVLPVVALGIWAAVEGQVGVAVAIGVLAIVVIALAGMITAVLSGVYQTALFRYAETGTTTPPFDAAQLAGGFRTKG